MILRPLQKSATSMSAVRTPASYSVNLYELINRNFFSSGSSGRLEAISSTQFAQFREATNLDQENICNHELSFDRIDRVSPLSGARQRVSCSTTPPDSKIPICRRASTSIACWIKRMEFIFLISHRIPKGLKSLVFRYFSYWGRQTETFTSA